MTAIKLNPEFSIQYTNLGLLYVEREMYSESIKWFTKSISINPKDSETYLNRGVSYLKLEEFSNAKIDLKKGN